MFKKYIRPFCSTKYIKENIGKIIHSKLENGINIITETETFPT